MRALFMRIWLTLLFTGSMSLSGLAQSQIITTYVGPQLPRDGDWATAPAIDDPLDAASDGAGGFYFSTLQGMVYHVTAEGRLPKWPVRRRR